MTTATEIPKGYVLTDVLVAANRALTDALEHVHALRVETKNDGRMPEISETWKLDGFTRDALGYLRDMTTTVLEIRDQINGGMNQDERDLHDAAVACA